MSYFIVLVEDVPDVPFFKPSESLDGNKAISNCVMDTILFRSVRFLDVQSHSFST